MLTLQEGDKVGLANGLASIALLPLTLDTLFPEQDWQSITRSYFMHIAQETQTHPLHHPGLYHGSCGVAYTLSLLAQQDPSYVHALKTLLARIIQQILSWNWYEHSLLAHQQNFETIGGAAGILRFLLTQQHEPEALPALEQIITYLIWVSEKQERWIHRPEHLGTFARERYPQGYIDLGLAHGLAGPLAALSLAILQGYSSSPGIRAAIERWSTWLISQQVTTLWGKDWPSVRPIPSTQDRGEDLTPARAAWCYGTPGIARAIWLAGQALADDSLRIIALEALAATLHRPAQERNIDSSQVCHGLASLLLVCLRFGHDDDATRIPWIHNAIETLTTALLSRWQQEYERLSPGFLTGATGGALTLIAALTHHEPIWDQVLLLS
jgi:hypothetical protein